ncbi:MAG TPA: NAD(P)/FAD-dependent oxidoreductase [Burkholderiales bacterium]|nr:NAD(P)/FAD-dependent oxidoreductase [Burkholderiales bacterium]
MDTRVCIVGAGPVGVVAAIACARKGLRVTLFEAAREIDHGPRAATTHPSTLEMLEKLGLLDEFQSVGLVARYFQFWDGATRTRVAEFDHDALRDETPFPYVVQTEQHKLSEIGLRRLAAMPNAEVRLGTSVVNVTQDARSARLATAGPEGREERDFDYVVGCDGGRSTVRKCLDIEFEGYTWPERFLVLTTLFDFETALGCCPRSYISDPREWTNLFKVMGDDLKGRWRAVFPVPESETDEAALSEASARRRLGKLGEDRAMDLLVHRNLYRAHQRVAKSFRRGRVFLAGDAAHVNNPVGGLGLNCGIHDAVELAETLHLVASGEAAEELLDRYERRRRPINVEYVQQQTVVNKKRLEESNPKVRQTNFDELRRTAADPQLHKQFLMRTSLIESVRKAKEIP